MLSRDLQTQAASCFKHLEITASYLNRFFHFYNSCIFNIISTTVAFSTLQASWTQTSSKQKKLDACNSSETRNPEQVLMTFSYCLLACYFSQTSQHKQQAAWSIRKSTKYVLHLWNLATTSIRKKSQAPWECLHKSFRRQAPTKERKKWRLVTLSWKNSYQTAQHNNTFPGPPDTSSKLLQASGNHCELFK